MKNKKNSKVLIAAGAALASLLLNVTSPVLACDDRSELDKTFDRIRQDERDQQQQWLQIELNQTQKGIEYELQQLNLKRHPY